MSHLGEYDPLTRIDTESEWSSISDDTQVSLVRVIPDPGTVERIKENAARGIADSMSEVHRERVQDNSGFLDKDISKE